MRNRPSDAWMRMKESYIIHVPRRQKSDEDGKIQEQIYVLQEISL